MEKAWHMTLSEYQQKVTPILKKYKKFVEKYPQYFKRADYSGLYYLTPQEFFDKEMEKLVAQGYKNIANKEYIDDSWLTRFSGDDKVMPDYEVPADIKKQYDEQIKVLEEIFGKYTKKVESDEIKNNKRTIRRVSEEDTYVEELLDKEITPERLQEIFDSVGLRIPKRIQDMKAKVEKQGYDRSTQKSKAARDKEFVKKVYDSLGSSVQVLKDRYRNRIEGLLDRWKKYADKPYKFETEIKDPLIFTMFSLVDKDRNKIPDFEKKMEALEKEYAESFILEFVYNINNKLVQVNEEFGYPEIKIENISFGKGRMEGKITMKYPSLELSVAVEVILAGGYNIQKLHERYLIKIFKDGKLVNLEKLDNLKKELKENRFQNFTEFLNEN
jgi:hypothetical protein